MDDFSKAQVKIDGGFTIDRSINFKKFNSKLANDWMLNPDSIPKEYAQWFKNNGIDVNALRASNIKDLMDNFKLTWHEHQNMLTAQLVPSAIHTARYGGISHLGGISILKKIQEANKLASTLNSLRSES